jgi:hypothetical protein
MSITARDLARYQAAAARFRSTPCTGVRRQPSGDSEAVFEGLCRIVPKGQYQPLGGAPLLDAPLWDIHLPPLADVRSGDLVLCPTLATAYGVVQVYDPRSYEVERRVQCYVAGSIADDGSLEVQPAAPPVSLPEACTIRRFGPQAGSATAVPGGGGPQDASVVATDVPVRITAASMEEYPFAAIPNQPQTRWSVLLPPAVDVRNNDLLLLDEDQRIYVVLRTDAPSSVEPVRTVHCLLSATQGKLGDAYLRPNATVSSTRPSTLGGLSSGYDARRVHLVYSQENPATSLERLTGGVATLSVGLFDLVDADIKQGDGVQLLSQDGPAVLPAESGFTVGGVVRRPLPFCVLQADLVAPV